MKKYLLHPGELSLKGKNKGFFEKRLIENLKLKAKKFGLKLEIFKGYGRYILSSENDLSNLLNTTFGIANWAEIYEFDLMDINTLSENILKIIKDLKIDFNSFKVETKRSNKSYPLNSMEISKFLGGKIATFFGKKVDLHNPDVTFYIEVTDRKIYFYLKKIFGLGGLPIGSSGKTISLISGGIDSPVASWLMMKRGLEVVFLHGYNEYLDNNLTTKNKIISLGKKLSEYQGFAQVYFFPFGNITKWIIENVKPDYRMLFFKIVLIKIANIVADIHGAKAIITGDNLAQVASQTLDNLNLIYNFSKYIVLSPLLGYDKIEIIDLAKKIGTYDISVNIKCDDVCSKIASKHPQTKGKKEYIENLMSNFNIEKIVGNLEGILNTNFIVI